MAGETERSTDQQTATTATAAPPPGGRGQRLLDGIERAGNKLPDPFILFVGLFAFLAAVSTVVAAFDVSITVPGSDQPLPVKGALTTEGLQFLLENLVLNFVGFPPLGTVLTILLGVGLAERVGLLEAAVRAAFSGAPRWLLPYAVAYVGMSANIASDASWLVVPPLAALVFLAAGRHPMAGLIGSFAAIGAGYASSVFITSLDALLSGISTEAAHTLPTGRDITVTPADNIWFNIASALIVPFVAGWITDRIIEPRLGPYRPEDGEQDGETGSAADATDPDKLRTHLNPVERRGLRITGLALLVYCGAIVGLALPVDGPLRGDGGALLPSPLIDGVIPLVFGFFLVAGLSYGLTTKAITKAADVPKMMTDAVRNLSGYIVLIFAAAQFIALFEWTNMGAFVAVKGAETLQATGLTGFPAILGFILLASVLNLFIVSGSAMWSLLAPVFIPMFLLVGYEPGFVQAAFRIGDSATQIITPMNPYLLILVGFARRFDRNVGLGTLISRLAVYVIPFWVLWVLLLAGFVVFGIDVGPGIGMRR